VIGKLRSGALVSLNACGEAIPACASDVKVFCRGAILTADVWGERLLVQTSGAVPPAPVEVPASMGVWEQFLAVRANQIENPCPPEVGLRMARLWDAIRASAAQGGKPVSTGA
jgi:predicted dehydrogenase